MSNENIKIKKSAGFHWVGNGFPVRSVFSYNDLGQELSPFLLLDYAEPYTFQPGFEKRGVEGHPHRGFETVTIVYQGELEHRDSSGGGGRIGPGDVQWMTAGSGIVHEEFHSEEFTREGGVFEVAQLWVNLPAKDKDAPPAYQTLLKDQISALEIENGAGSIRIIAGEFSGKKGPAKTFTPMNIWDVSLNIGKKMELPLPQDHTKAILLTSGEMSVDGVNASGGDLIILGKKDKNFEISAAADCRFLLMSGEPINEPVVGYGPFVMNSQAEIKQAYADYKSGKFGILKA